MRYILFLVLGLILSSCINEKNTQVQLDILYTNDLHANFDPMLISSLDSLRLIGGFANIASKVKYHKSLNDHTIYIDAGDWFSGPAFSSLTEGRAVIEVLNEMDLDAACLGNHEFDHGGLNLLEQLARAEFPVVNGNIFVDSTDKLIAERPYTIINKNGLRVGVIGLHGKFAFFDTVSDTMTKGLRVEDEEKFLKAYIDTLRPKVDILVLLVHEGIPGRQSSIGTNDVSRTLNKDIELASKVDGIDILITGHTHQGTLEPLISNGTLIVSTNALGKEVGLLKLTYDKNEERITEWENKLELLYDDQWEDDSATTAVIEFWRDSLKTITSKMVGKIPEPLRRSYGSESSLGNMVADAMLNTWSNADLALINSGGLREDIIGPEVTVGDIIAAFPFPNIIVNLKINGYDLLKIFEHSASLKNGLMQVSEGVSLEFDLEAPIGNRVVDCRVNGVEIDSTMVYNVVTNNFLADGGDGYYSFTDAEYRKNKGVSIQFVMEDYLEEGINKNVYDLVRIRFK
jgi:2',3'-cyclic-nucleotide 2'-phosphodiesterase (5'-nucleotidase family)